MGCTVSCGLNRTVSCGLKSLLVPWLLQPQLYTSVLISIFKASTGLHITAALDKIITKLFRRSHSCYVWQSPDAFEAFNRALFFAVSRKAPAFGSQGEFIAMQVCGYT